VNALCPGFIATPLISQAGIAEGSGPWETIGNLHALKRWGTAEEVAAAAVWLCSDKASFVTGSGMLIDGGYAAQ
jgi:Dehydrogenases with different specificities (related to short-chain alcohol dehydrogenases)